MSAERQRPIGRFVAEPTSASQGYGMGLRPMSWNDADALIAYARAAQARIAHLHSALEAVQAHADRSHVGDIARVALIGREDWE